MKTKLKILTIYLYIFLLVAFSGNPFFSPTDDEFSRFTLATLVLILSLRHFTYFDIKKGLPFYLFLLFFIAIFIFQKLFLGFVSIFGAIGFLLKLTLGYIVIRYIGVNFKLAYFNLIFIISFVSLFGYAWNYFGNDIPAIYIKENTALYSDNSGRNILLFHQLSDGLRNSGMFWEPGAFACYINLVFLFYIGKIRSLVENNKFKVIIILLALLTTYSTTGYIVLFLIGLVTIFIEYSNKNGILVIPILLMFGTIAFITYEKSDFLKEKMNDQFEVALNRDKGEFAPDRISAFLFDIHYIKKHPLIGNGLHSETRYADHPWLKEETLGHGNGFSNFVASMGILSLLFYTVLILKNKRIHSWIFVLGIFTLLQGEPLMNFPLYLSLPFIFIYEKNYSRTINLP
ncbi:O-antigen ligase like membrane protein [Arenibacter palladensis]|uniref:O-antigen ligase like membrane protein n=1 Tax=Arenibacter palladensis TaxID=237373 RepID=A0A1M5G4V0_9FLAO|nr:O-antigen ligase family protein [Arenibacter palladensis]SHF98753.1 O-antigen ligase like membrane protein [Arenibacter palladensis]